MHYRYASIWFPIPTTRFGKSKCGKWNCSTVLNRCLTVTVKTTSTVSVLRTMQTPQVTHPCRAAAHPHLLLPRLLPCAASIILPTRYLAAGDFIWPHPQRPEAKRYKCLLTVEAAVANICEVICWPRRPREAQERREDRAEVEIRNSSLKRGYRGPIRAKFESWAFSTKFDQALRKIIRPIRLLIQAEVAGLR